MTIGNVTIAGKAALAPMAGVADRAFRKLCVENGAAYVVGEMVSCKGLCFGDAKSEELLSLDPQEHPAAIQLFGDDPDTMARAAQKAMTYHPDILDINMGCPAPKIAGNGCGSALMRDPERCRAIVAAVAGAVPVPVTAKIRKGYSREESNAVEVALACQEGGAAAITVHGRTRDQMYAPPVDWNIIRQVKQALSIPVIGNGDVTSPETAAALYEETGCDLVMVGRGALGAPWLFAQIEAFLTHGTRLPDPSLSRPDGAAAPPRGICGTVQGRTGGHAGNAQTRRLVCPGDTGRCLTALSGGHLVYYGRPGKFLPPGSGNRRSWRTYTLTFGLPICYS